MPDNVVSREKNTAAVQGRWRSVFGPDEVL